MDVPIGQLTYSPLCSWSMRGPGVLFNSDVLCIGEMFKAVAVVESGYERLHLRIIGDGERSFDRMVSEYLEDPALRVQGIALDTSEHMAAGSYLAQVYSPTPKDWERSEGRASNYIYNEGNVVLGEHRFHVLEPEDYQAHWRALFGETWDEPVYWDSLEPGQADELLAGLPLDDLFEVLPEDFEINARNLGQLLSPIATALMAHEAGGLPYIAEFTSRWNVRRPPHLDLTKLFWLLNALAPVMVNASFFSRRASLRTRVEEDRLTLGVELSPFPGFREHFPESESEIEKSFPLIPLVQRLAEVANIEVYPGKYFELTVKADSAEASYEQDRPHMRFA